MAKIWSGVLFPLAVAGALTVQTLGVDVSRSRPVLSYQDPPDSLFFFGEDTTSFEEPDTLPKITARDTMKVPDSLRQADPFRYKWYVAIKDSLTHRIVVDSLRQAGDTLDWPVIDSLYLSDSTAVAVEKFNKWYAGLSKAERKRYDYEQRLPAIRHRQDSIQHRKDSIKNRRDSIIQNTPRILETSFLPDSLHYKRLVTWHHDRLYNKVEVFEWDTTANYHFYDYPFMRQDVGASWLGMPGSAVQQYNYFLRDNKESVSFYEAIEPWTYSASSIPMFNTKTPYTELEYSGNLFTNSTKSADSYRVFTTQNIIPELNIALEMRRHGGAGTLKNEETDNRTYFVTGNWLGKKYLAHGGFIYNKLSRQESGGVQDITWVRDTTVDVREIEVNLAAATNSYRKTTLFYDQSYRISMKRDTLDQDGMAGFVGSSTEYSVFSKKYVDNTSTALSAFYNDVFNLNPTKSTDSLRTARLENRVFVRFQPWKEDAVVSKIEGGIGDRYQNFYLLRPGDYLTKPAKTNWNSVYAYAGVEGSYRKYLKWDATGLVNFAGTEAGDFNVRANAKISMYPFRRHKDSPLSITARVETDLKTPSFYEQNFYSNHYSWSNSFSKISTTKVNAGIDIPHWHLHANAAYALLSGNIYYDKYGIVRQNTTPMSVFSAGLRQDFILGVLHLENSALFQLSSNKEVLPLPTLALNLRWYLQFNVVDPSIMKLQLGINARYNTLWYAPSYNPVAGVFMLQDKVQYGNTPIFDAFINIQWKKCCIFLKFENAGKGWPLQKHDYFVAHQYIQPPQALKFGICWPFYPRLGSSKTLSSRAGSGLGGNSGGSGLGSGLGGLLKGSEM